MAGLWAMALTDHDTVAGVPAAVAEGNKIGVRVISGCEFSVAAPWGEMHLLGYFIPAEDQDLNSFLADCRAMRERRAERIVEALRNSGVDATIHEVKLQANGGAIGRPHIARVLVHKEVVPTIQDAFLQYLGKGRPAYVAKELPTLAEVTERVHRAGGVVSAAHLRDRATWSFVNTLKFEGVDGIEVLHPSHPPELKRKLETLVRRLGLVPTGGSDWHGGGGADHHLSRPGSEQVPAAWLDELELRRPSVPER